MTKTIDWLQPAIRYGEQWLDYQIKTRADKQRSTRRRASRA